LGNPHQGNGRRAPANCTLVRIGAKTPPNAATRLEVARHIQGFTPALRKIVIIGHQLVNAD
jgi:hypothetical protein